MIRIPLHDTLLEELGGPLRPLGGSLAPLAPERESAALEQLAWHGTADRALTRMAELDSRMRSAKLVRARNRGCRVGRHLHPARPEAPAYSVLGGLLWQERVDSN